MEDSQREEGSVSRKMRCIHAPAESMATARNLPFSSADKTKPEIRMLNWAFSFSILFLDGFSKRLQQPLTEM